MRVARTMIRVAAGVALVLGTVAPAGATTLERAGLDRLVAENATVVVGTVLEVHSYWNADGSFILSDVRLAADEVLKGDARARDLVFTVMGGTVGDLSTLIVAGPEIEVGNRYVLFLNAEDLPGVAGASTVRDLAQGIFDVVEGPKGARALSQARNHPLVPDAFGNGEPVGGSMGLPLDDLVRDIRRLAGRR